MDDRHEYRMSKKQDKYAKSEKGKKAREKARNKYDKENVEKRKQQKRDYMRRRREVDPSYCKWK